MSTSTTVPKVSPAKVAFASFVGTTVEWYDYFIFGTAAVLVLNEQFFPTLDPVAGRLAAFATFSVAFVARPLGSILFGHYGDRVGRKKMLVYSLLGMGLATVLVGVLPGYATIGIAAPVVLVALRFVQGFAVGGEWGGAALMALEHAPARKRAFFASWPQAGVPAGIVLATGAFYLVQLMPEAQFQAWGWRIPFLASAALIAVGLYIRLRITESPEFEALQQVQARREEPQRAPIGEVLRGHKRSVLIGALSIAGGNTVFYLATVYMLAHGPQDLGFDRGLILLMIMAAAAIDIVSMPLVAMIADRIGRKRLLQFGAVIGIVIGVPMFALFQTGTAWGIFLAAFLALPVGHAFSSAVITSFIPGLFETRVRYTGAGLSYQLSGIIASAPAPFVATFLYASTQSSLAVGAYLSAVSLVALAAISCGPRTHLDREVTPAQGLVAP
ncbi:MFS transporter [Pseudonocardia sp. MH-G8]|uniref:MFS transporter n=1 Tax=Pseudonocardia sp. MH-G8 TaxID=1854588 RepID=UPI000BA0AE37|nr:MFS transporter [Pseudonocardia sp. MH-G8]OZM77448.1 MFS transporter [Pseudonocardia sp. MH-G8]